MNRFNLIDEPWIPVKLLDGTRIEWGIKETLLRSKEIASIEDASPLVVAALYRFLLAVLYRALEGPTDIDQAKSLFATGLPSEKIIAYLQKWEDRFWLFHEKYPFSQIPEFEPSIWKPWTVLAAEHNADNAKVLFDHIDVSAAGTISPAFAARWILATQTFSLSSGKSELSHTGTAPSASSLIVIPLGINLQDTLLMCLVPQNRDILLCDLPLWERDPEPVTSLKSGIKRSLDGFADRYTWRTRAIRLNINESGQIEKLGFASGVENSLLDQIDPMVAYRIDDKKGKLPIQFRERGTWRDFDSLLPDTEGLAPKVIEHAKALTRSNRTRFPRSVIVVGQANNKAKVEYWRFERFILPEALIGEASIRTEIENLLTDAEDSQKSLWIACSSFARDLLSKGDRNPDPKDIRKLVDQMSAISWYWTTLEFHFSKILEDYTLEVDSEDIQYKWLRNIRDTLEGAWGRHASSVARDTWTTRALVKAESTIRKKVIMLDKEIKKFEPKREVL